ncbi:hypothetical protein IKA92_03515 [bacterium]|nr:hypothetical protein [bacterium]
MINAIKEMIKSKIYGVVRADDTKRAVEIASAYLDAGIKFIEINSNIEAIKEISKRNDAIITAGGIITTWQADEAIEAGAKLLSSPILQMGLVKFCSWHKMPLILSATTPNEAYTAWRARVPLIKIYPVKDLGGATYIEDILRPMNFLNVIAAGNVKIEDIKSYIKAGASAVALGRELYLNKDYKEIYESAKIALGEVKEASR